MDTLNFDELVADYYTNLHTTLRNFRPGPEYLESWVHDEDTTRSLLGIFESASDFGLKALAVRLGADSAASLDREELRTAVSSFGSLTWETHGSDLVVTLQFSRSQTVTVHPAYQESLEKRSRQLQFNRPLGTDRVDGEFVLEEAIADCLLAVRVTADGLVKAAGHAGQGIKGALLDRVCEELTKRPLQEGAEHAVIRAEYALRSAKVAPPVTGLITPQNADPLLAETEKGVQRLYRKFQEITGQSAQWNDYEDPIGEKWKLLGEDARLEALQKTIENIVAAKALPYRHLTVVGLKHDTRVILNANLYRSVARLGADLLEIEKAVKAELEPRLELTLESLDDQNRRETRTDREGMSASP